MPTILPTGIRPLTPDESMHNLCINRRPSNPGEWNETRFAWKNDKCVTDWPETVSARLSNAPVLYGGIGAGLVFLLVRTFR